MCVEEEGDGKAIGGGVSSIIHQLMDQTAPPIYLTLQGAERDLLLSGPASLFMLPSPSFSPLSLCTPSWGWMKVSVQPGAQRIDHCCIGRADRRAFLWVMPPGGSTLGSSRRADLWPARMRPIVGWTSQKVYLHLQTSSHCTTSHTVQDTHFAYF